MAMMIMIIIFDRELIIFLRYVSYICYYDQTNQNDYK